MIQIKEVSKSFHDIEIFRSVHLFVKKEESAVIVGPSGSGKSTLLKIIAGLEAATSGEVSVESTEIGMLFQKNALFDSLSVEENLLFPLRERKGLIGKNAKEKASYFLEQVGLLEFSDRYPDQLSGGMQKRLGIARTLIVEPEVILYDDPTAGLDPITSKKIVDMIIRLRQEVSSTLVTVTNDIQRAYQLADSIYLLAQGELTPGGSPEEVKKTNHPALSQFTQGLTQGPLTHVDSV